MEPRGTRALGVRVVALAWLCAGFPAAAIATATQPLADALRAGVSAARAGRAPAGGEEPVLSRHVLPALYEGADFQPQWTDPRRLAGLVAGLEGLVDDGLDPADYHTDALRRLAPDLERPVSAEAAARLDLMATDALVLALYHLSVGKVDPRKLDPDWNFRPHPITDAQILEAVQTAIRSGRIAEAFARARPDHPLYASGRAVLARYRAIAAKGGWPMVPAGPALKPGASDPRVPVLRQRLAVEGDYTGSPGDATEYDAALAHAVEAFQARHVLDADGTVGPGTIRELNVSAQARVAQIRVNLERARWVLHDLGPGDHVVVDIAGYGVRYLHDGHVAWQSRVIVGQPARQTPSFRSDIQSIVFNPHWTVPPGILAKDVLPAMKRGENVLARKRLKVVDRAGRPVDPSTIDWSRYTASNFPYYLRQDSGDDNALGRVKIDFPNPHLVYLHDTPTRALFEKDRRNFSSGCIRVENPLELVERLLDDPVNWNRAAIDAAIAKGDTRTVRLRHPVPVLLIYWTVDKDAEGRTVFKPDAYGLDAKLLRALDGKPPPMARRPG